MQHPPPRPVRLTAPGPLAGHIRIPGDKSISHRALILAALAVGESRIDGLLESEDIAATAAALRAMGANIVQQAPGRWVVHGVGLGSLLQPDAAFQMGNSGTSTRLLAGLVATHPITTTFIGDASLGRRPMARIIQPLAQTGATFTTAPGGRLPMMIAGAGTPLAVRHRLQVASAQVKSAILLAGLNVQAETVVEEPFTTRDHSERMLQGFGANIEVATLADGARRIAVTGWADLKPQTLQVPGDISSAAFPLVAALIVPDSDITIEAVGVNPTRDGILRVLELMGADIRRENPRTVSGEPVADLRVRHSQLRGIEVPPDHAPLMIDEFPILFVASAFAEGTTSMRGIGELRVKESDRIANMARGLQAAGVGVQEHADGLQITGRGGESFAGGVTIASDLDHRIAMSFAILSLRTRRPVTVDDAAPIATSFPDFLPLMQSLGATVA